MNLEPETADTFAASPWASNAFYSPTKDAEWDALLGEVMLPGHLKIRPHASRHAPSRNACSGRAATARLPGGGVIADLHMPALEVVHRPEHLVHTSAHETLIHLVQEGSGEMMQANTRFRFQAGDITFRDAHQPSSVRFSGTRVRLLAMRVPVTRWQNHEISFAPRGPLLAPGAHALTQAIHGFVHPLKNGLPNANRIAMTALEQSFVLMLGAAYRQFSPDESANRIQPENPKWQQILAHIETHLFDVLLTPAHCARALRISERYLYRICAEHGEHFSKILLRRRLDACAERLRDSCFARYQIASIAYQCGFTSAAHFSRAFSVRFGVAPRAWRNRTNA